MDELLLLPAVDLAREIRQRRVSSRELLTGYLERIERINPALNAVVTLDAEAALDRADTADRATASGTDLGPLHGLPVTVKDAIETAGIRSTGGAVELRDHVPTADAPSVARLRRAGAVVFGKTNVPRWSGDIQTFNDVFGTTNNPWDQARTPGGSSGGAATAVASGLTSFEIGTDIGGSVRIPSGFCGVFGHKPSYGIISQRGYLDRVGGGVIEADVNVFGPMARSAADLQVLLDVLAGPDVENAKAWRLDLPRARHDDLRRYRIATWFDDPLCPVEAECVEVLENAAAALGSAGASVVATPPPVAMSESFRLFNSLLMAAISLSADDPALGDAISGTHRAWLLLHHERTRLRQAWERWFDDFDAYLCPIMPMPAFPHDHEGTVGDRVVVINGEERNHVDALAWTGAVGVAYLPSTAVPVGFTRSGLPVGMQVVGPYLEDRTSLYLAARLEELLGGFTAPAIART